MSVSQRLERVFETLYNYELDETSEYGAYGEKYAQNTILQNNWYVFFNRIIPHPTKERFLEIDAIIYAEGAIFCVEIKRYKGKIYFPAKYKTKKVKKKFLFWSYESEEKVFDGYDDSRIIKEKEGNYKEDTFYKEFPNPLKKTRYFIYNLKRYLSKFDSRFAHVYIIPIVGFSDEESDISAIHSIKDGMVYISEIPQVVEYYRNEKFTNSHSKWIIDGLEKLSTWDAVITRTGEYINGIIKGKEFVCKTKEGRIYSEPYKNIKSVNVAREGILSAYDDVKVLKMNGETDNLLCMEGAVNLDRFGENQLHRLRNIKQIIIGTTYLRGENIIL